MEEVVSSELSDVAVEQIEDAKSTNALKDEVANLKSKLAYMIADFDNYKKRCQREKVDIISSASEDLAKEIFPIVDNFQMAKAALEDANVDSNVASGVNMVMNDLVNVLNKHGFMKVKVNVGDMFDIDKCEAISSEESELDENAIVRIYSTGWMHNGKVIKPAKVSVAKQK